MDFSVHCDETFPDSWDGNVPVIIATLERDMVLLLYGMRVFAAFSHRERRVKAFFSSVDDSNVSYEKYYDPGEYMNFLRSKTGVAEIVRKIRNLETERALEEL